MPCSSTQWFKFSTRQSKYTRRTNTSIQWIVAKLPTCLPAGWNISLRDRRTCNYGSCLKVVFCFNASKGWEIYLSAGLPISWLPVSGPPRWIGGGSGKIACGRCCARVLWNNERKIYGKKNIQFTQARHRRVHYTRPWGQKRKGNPSSLFHL